MDDRKMQIIQQLMDELKEEMEPSGDDLGQRLGREPKVEVLKMDSGEMPMDGDEGAMDGAIEGDMLDPEEKFKQRLMKLRG